MRNNRVAIFLVAAVLSFLTSYALADWSPAKRLTWTADESWNPVLAIDSGGVIHVVWYDYTPGNSEIFYKSSTDGGASWNPNKRLSWTPGDSEDTAVAIDSSGTLHVVWADYTPGNFDIYYRKSEDTGATWSPTRRITWTSGASLEPAIAIDSSSVIHVVWYDGTPGLGQSDIYYKSSENSGATWSPARRITWTPALSYNPAIATDPSGAIHIVWYDYLAGNREIYYKASPDGGISWSAARRLTWTAGDSYSPVVATDSIDGIHVVWEDNTPGNREIYYKKSSDGGTTWDPVQRITWTSGESYDPAMAVDSSDAIHIVLADFTSDGYEIYYKKSDDAGISWSAAQRITWTSGGSYSPAIALDSGNSLHVVWMDNTPGNREIYYKKGN